VWKYTTHVHIHILFEFTQRETTDLSCMHACIVAWLTTVTGASSAVVSLQATKAGGGVVLGMRLARKYGSQCMHS